MIRTVQVTRYLAPLREGGSLPAIVEADDDGTYVLKFRGAGQGANALVAELLSGEIARLLRLPMPEIVFAHLDTILAQTEPDPEIQDLIRASDGLNLALDYLPGSITFDPLVPHSIENDARLASKIVWFDAFVTNIDRTPRNTNLLVWHRKLWLIDHGASLYFHHAWNDYLARAGNAFSPIKNHVLLPWAHEIASVDEEMTTALTPEVLHRVLDLVPESWLGESWLGASWLGDGATFGSAQAHRAAYIDYFLRRLQTPRNWVATAIEEANTVQIA